MENDRGQAPNEVLRQVGKELSKIEDSTASLIKRVQEMEGRLGQVLLSPPDETGAIQEKQPEEQKVVLAVQLEAFNYQIQNATRSIGALMDRMEL